MGEFCFLFISLIGFEIWESFVELGNDFWGFFSKFFGRNFVILVGMFVDKYIKDMELMF